jgi:calcineurin-like phosphoesterase family protein
MARFFFSSDHHVGHANLVRGRMHTRRPFTSIEEHDEALVAAWNAAVGPDDTVWHLSDFCYRCGEAYARSLFGRLAGRYRYLVRGNHDRISVRLPWDGIFDVAQVSVPDPSTGAPVGLFLFHYACRVWPRMHRGDIHLYGHSHGTLPGTAASTDVGVDCFEFRPVTLVEIRARLAENARAQGEVS